MQKLVGIVTKRPKTRASKDDDFVDRLNHKYTVVIIVVFAVVISSTTYVGKPITCWAPKHFTGSHIKYTNSYCWVRNTYYLPFEQEIPRVYEERHEIVYYQWVPFILLAQALFFYLPCAIWTGLNQRGGVDSDHIMDAAGTFQSAKKFAVRDKIAKFIAKQMDRFLDAPDKKTTLTVGCKDCLTATLFRCLRGKGGGCYLVVLYLFTKSLYIVNVICQFFLLNRVLSANFSGFGSEVIRNWNSDFDEDFMWGDTSTFPRVTMCDFNIRRLGNVHRYTVQCLLQINLYTEKVYAVLWFWMLFIAIASSLSFLQWLIRALFQWDRISYIQGHLAGPGKIKMDDPGDRALSKEFVTEYLRQDGVFILRMISSNQNYITATEIICAVYENWTEKPRKRTKAGDEVEAEDGELDPDRTPEKKMLPE